MPIAVNHPAVTAHRGFLYVYGGYTDSSFGPVTAALQRFDPRTGRWKLMPPSPTPRAAAALAARNGMLYAVGGASGDALRTLEVYDVASHRWHSAPPMRTPREHIAAVATGDGVYVLGGRSSAGELDTVELFDPKRRRWLRLPDLLHARSGFAAVGLRGRPIAFGGEELTPVAARFPRSRFSTPTDAAGNPCPPCSPPATASAPPPWAAGSTLSRAAQPRVSPSPARSSSWMCRAHLGVIQAAGPRAPCV